MNKTIYLTLFLIIPLTSFGQLAESLKKMQNDKNIEFKKYEPLLFKATSYIFNNPANPRSTEFIAAAKIVSFWMNKDIGMGIPLGGEFYKSLTNKQNQQFLYTVAMINYGLDQKVNKNRILKCLPIEGKKYSEQEDVKEVQLGGAKILLEYIGNRKNNIPMNSKTKKYYKAYKKGNLKEKLKQK
ncbi:hypothetical protein [uncultured Tenacibaculum sp.]|uniref:hypothetical protein n=1 Tax=uncultured Tenacibaculum sp. TaxID=174713 RepID=UPI00262AA35F|nr:hypothetical protein [uncultured Tenacibaculum sp.]